MYPQVNFDFVQWSNVDCVVDTSYYDRWLAICLVPLGLLVAVLILYLLPKYIQSVREREMDMVRPCSHWLML